MINVCLIDDHAIVRDGLKRIIQQSDDIRVLAEGGSGRDLLTLFETIQKTLTVLILDLSLPDMTGVDLLKIVRQKTETLPVLILSMHNEEQYGMRVFKAGANGYVTKDKAAEELLNAIRMVAKGRKYISPEFADLMATSLTSDTVLPSYDKLSDREFETLRLLGKGSSMTEIAEKMFISIKTASTYRSRIQSKLGLDNIADIVKYCIDHSLI